MSLSPYATSSKLHLLFLRFHSYNSTNGLQNCTFCFFLLIHYTQSIELYLFLYSHLSTHDLQLELHLLFLFLYPLSLYTWCIIRIAFFFLFFVVLVFVKILIRILYFSCRDLHCLKAYFLCWSEFFKVLICELIKLLILHNINVVVFLLNYLMLAWQAT